MAVAVAQQHAVADEFALNILLEEPAVFLPLSCTPVVASPPPAFCKCFRWRKRSPSFLPFQSKLLVPQWKVSLTVTEFSQVVLSPYPARWEYWLTAMQSALCSGFHADAAAASFDVCFY